MAVRGAVRAMWYNFPVNLSHFVERMKFVVCSALTAVDATARSPYIGGGPRLPNEVLSFWKE